MAIRHCHRGLKTRTKLLGLDIEVTFGASIAFALVTKLGASVLVAAFVAAGAAWAIDSVRRGRLPGIGGSLRDYLRWPAFHPAHGHDDVPHFPDPDDGAIRS